MNFTITRSNLLYVIQAVHRTGQAKVTMPILGGILFKAIDNTLIATSTDIDLTTQCKIQASIIEEGSFCLPARQIADIVRHLPDTVIQIEGSQEKSSVRIIYGESEVNINGFSPEQFPDFPVPLSACGHAQAGKGITSLLIPKNTFKDMIRRAIFAVSTDRTRPLFTGVLFEVQDQKLRLVATDTHRLALAEITLEDMAPPPKSIVVPGSALNELIRIIRVDLSACSAQAGEESVAIETSENHIFFITEDTTIASRLIAGQFPSYTQVVPDKFTSRLRANVKEIHDAVERAALLSQEEIPVIHLSLSMEQCTIFLSGFAGWIRERLNATYEGEPLEVFFNARYLMDCLRVIPTEEVVIEYTGSLGAAVIRSWERDDHFSLLLPARPRSEEIY
jgi:DNA polymerase-3 subunit beta